MSLRVAFLTNSEKQPDRLLILPMDAGAIGKIFTTVFPVRQSPDGGRQVLLGQSKTGPRIGKWYGFGGEVNSDSVESCAVRELEATCGLSAPQSALQRHGDFVEVFDGTHLTRHHIFLAPEFQGTERDCEAVHPTWFDFDKIPFEDMWPGLHLWLPSVLNGEGSVRGKVHLDGGLLGICHLWHLRRATASDWPEIAKMVIENHLALSADCPAEWLNQLRDVPNDFPHLLNEEMFSAGRYHVAVVQGRIAGSVGITPVRDEWKLTAVSVAPHCRRWGIGEELVTTVLSDAQDVGAKKLTLVTLRELMEPAWHLYEKLGFQWKKETLVMESPRPLTVLEYEVSVSD